MVWILIYISYERQWERIKLKYKEKGENSINGNRNQHIKQFTNNEFRPVTINQIIYSSISKEYTELINLLVNVGYKWSPLWYGG